MIPDLNVLQTEFAVISECSLFALHFETCQSHQSARSDLADSTIQRFDPEVSFSANMIREVFVLEIVRPFIH